MAVELTYWYDRILTHCPGLDETAFGVALHKVMRDYFKRSHAWKETLTVQGLQGESSWDLDAPFQDPSDVYKRVAQIWVVYDADNRPMQPLTQPAFNIRYHENVRPYWWADQPNVLVFSQPLSEDLDFLVDVSIQPADGINEVPDFVEQHHDDAIEAGLLAYFLAMPAKPWTNLQIAAHHKSEYREMVGEARAVAVRSYTPADVQWTYPRTFV